MSLGLDLQIVRVARTAEALNQLMRKLPQQSMGLDLVPGADCRRRMQAKSFHHTQNRVILPADFDPHASAKAELAAKDMHSREHRSTRCTKSRKALKVLLRSL